MADTIMQVAPADEVHNYINIERLREAQGILQKYKDGKANLDRKLIEAEDWWKMSHYRDFRHLKWMVDAKGNKMPLLDHLTVKKQSAWMFNSIMGKHADIMDNFPDPVIMARSKDDETTAKLLSSVVPVILENCKFEETYSDNSWDKLCFGSCCYAVVWNSDLLNGLGDIEVRPVDMLSIYWEPGVQDIQDSQHLFVLSLMDNKLLNDIYPQTRDRVTGSVLYEKQYNYDDQVDTTDKSVIVDWYYKTKSGTRTILNYVKYVDDIILYSSEDDPQHPEYRENGYYNHGKYPFVIDSLYREKGTPAGFGYVDIMRTAQEQIDSLSADFMENARWGSKPRYFSRNEGGVNLEEFRNLEQEIVHVAGSVDEQNLRLIDTKPLDGNYINIYQSKIDELKETSGNRDFNQGSPASGVTSGAAIAALQEAGSKGSRDLIKSAYRAFSGIVELIVELIRQFYDTPRTFRIVGEEGMTYAEIDNTAMLPGINFVAGEMFETKEPVFDIIVKAQKANPYSRLAQNELALQLYQLGFFNPELSDQALSALDMMDFDGKDKVMQKIQQNGTMFQQIQMLQQQLMMLASAHAEATGDTRVADALMAQEEGAPAPAGGNAQIAQRDNMGEPMEGNSVAAQRRRQAATATEVR